MSASTQGKQIAASEAAAKQASERVQRGLEAEATRAELLPWSFPRHQAEARRGLLEPVRVQSIAAGVAHALLLDQSGGLWGIGRAHEGQLGCGDLVGGYQSKAVPVQALRGRRVVTVAAGGWHSLAIDALGVAFVWGDNRSGQCGAGRGKPSVRLPAELRASAAKGGAAASGACGLLHTVVVRAADRAGWVAGSNRFGQCGTAIAGAGEDDEDGGEPDSTTVDAAGVSNDSGATAAGLSRGGLPAGGPAGGAGAWQDDATAIWAFRLNKRLCRAEAVSVACGYGHTVLVSEVGTLWTCGRGDGFQLGHGVSRSDAKPARVRDLADEWVVSAAAGATHTVVATETGRVFACGTGTSGQLGLGKGVTTAQRFTEVTGMPPAERVSAGPEHTMAVSKTTMHLFVWGEQSAFRLGEPGEFKGKAPTMTILGTVAAEHVLEAKRKADDEASRPGGASVGSPVAGHRQRNTTLSGVVSARGPLWEPVGSTAMKRASDSRIQSAFPFADWEGPPFPGAALGEADEVKAAIRELAGLPKEVVGKLSDAEILEMKRGFDQVDADGSGAIDAAELHSALLGVGESTVKHDDVEAIIIRFDDSGDGELQLDEFVQLVMAVRGGDQSIGIGASLAVMLASGNEISAAANAKLQARLQALEPANVRLEGRRVFQEHAGTRRAQDPYTGLTPTQLGEAMRAMGLAPPPPRALTTLARELASGPAGTPALAASRGSGSRASTGLPLARSLPGSAGQEPLAVVSEAAWLSYVSAAHPLANPEATDTERALARVRWHPRPRVDLVRIRRFVQAFETAASEEEVALPASLTKRLAEIAGQEGRVGALAREGVLSFRSCGLRDTHLSVLCEALRRVPVAQELDVTRNSITDAGAAVLISQLDEQLTLAASGQGAGGAGRVVERGTEFLEGFAGGDDDDDDHDDGGGEDGDGGSKRAKAARQQAKERAQVVRLAESAARQRALMEGLKPADAEDLARAAGEAAGVEFDRTAPPIEDSSDDEADAPQHELNFVDLNTLEEARNAYGLDDRDDMATEAASLALSPAAEWMRSQATKAAASAGAASKAAGATRPGTEATGVSAAEEGADYTADLATEQRNAVWGCVPWLRVNFRAPSPLVWLGLRGREARLKALDIDALPDGGPDYNPLGRPASQRRKAAVFAGDPDSPYSSPPGSASTFGGPRRGARRRGGHPADDASRRMAANVDELFREGTPAAERSRKRMALAESAAAAGMLEATPAPEPDRALGPLECPRCHASDLAFSSNPAGRTGAFQLIQDVLVCAACKLQRTNPVHLLRTVRIADSVKPERLLTLAKYNLQTGSRARLRAFIEGRTFQFQTILHEAAGLDGDPAEPPAGWEASISDLSEEYKVIIESHVDAYSKAIAPLVARGPAVLAQEHADELAGDLREYGKSLFPMHERDYFAWTRVVMRQRAAECVNRMLDESRTLYLEAYLPLEWEGFASALHRLRSETWESLLAGLGKWSIQDGDKLALKATMEAAHDRLVAFFETVGRHVRVQSMRCGDSTSVMLSQDGEAWLFGGERGADVSAPRVVFLARPKRVGGTAERTLEPRSVAALYGCERRTSRVPGEGPVMVSGHVVVPVEAGGVAIWDGVHAPSDATFAAISLSFDGPAAALGAPAPVAALELRVGDRTGPMLARVLLKRATVDAARQGAGGEALEGPADGPRSAEGQASPGGFAPSSGAAAQTGFLEPATAFETLTAPLDAKVLAEWEGASSLVLVASEGAQGARVARVELC